VRSGIGAPAGVSFGDIVVSAAKGSASFEGLLSDERLCGSSGGVDGADMVVSGKW